MRSGAAVMDAVRVLKRGVPELQDAVDCGILAVSAAAKAIEFSAEQQRAMVTNSLAQAKPVKAFWAARRNAKSQSHHQQIVVKAQRYDLGGKRYLIVVVDFPWEGRVSWAVDPFPRLSIEQICQFQVDDGRLLREVIADDAIVYLWVPDKLLLDPQHPLQRIYRAWGDLKPRHLMPWPKSSIKTGHHARYQHETCLVCTRGNFPAPEEVLRQSTLIVGPPYPAGVAVFTGKGRGRKKQRPHKGWHGPSEGQGR